MSKGSPLKLENLSLATFANVAGGALAVALDREIRKAYLDCMDSPEANSARTVSLKLKLKPSMRPAAETFELSPKPGQIAAAQSQALDALRSRVAEVTGLSLDRVLAGKP